VLYYINVAAKNISGGFLTFRIKAIISIPNETNSRQIKRNAKEKFSNAEI